MMKGLMIFVFGALFSFSARADNDAFYGWVKIGSFGDLAYERNAEGKIVKKRNDDDIRNYVAKVVDNTLKTRGLSVFPDRKNKDVKTAVKVTENEVSFNVYDQSGMMLFPFSVNREKSMTQTEAPAAERKAARAKADAAERRFSEEQTMRRKKVFDKIKREEKKK